MLTSINTTFMPFISQTDSTRINMATKQLGQTLTHPNCEIPYVLNNHWKHLRDTSTRGVCIAKDDGEVIINNSDIMIILYPSIKNGKGAYEIKKIPPIMKTHSSFCSSLRNSLPSGTKFKKGDIIYEYDSFHDGYPTFGYNVSTMFTPFFGFNHEDGCVVSESFAQKARHKLIEKVYIPIFEFTILQKIYNNQYGYFPELKEKILGDIVCCSLLPKECKGMTDFDPSSIRGKVVSMLQRMNLTDLLSMRSSNLINGFLVEKILSKVENGKISGVKIHRINNIPLLDNELNTIMEKMYNDYGHFVYSTYDELSKVLGDDFTKSIMKRFYLYSDKDKLRGDYILKDVVYIIELEIEKEDTSHLGDKFANRL